MSCQQTLIVLRTDNVMSMNILKSFHFDLYMSLGIAYGTRLLLHPMKPQINLLCRVVFAGHNVRSQGSKAFLCGSTGTVPCLCVGGFICGVCFVIVCFSSLLRLMPLEGCASCLWHLLGFFTYIQADGEA